MAYSRRRLARGSGLSGVAWDPQQLYREADRCGGQPRNFFDKKARRFFNSRVTSTFVVPSKKTTYFVESFGGGRTPVGKKYRVGVFKNCQVTILGKGSGASGFKKTYATSAQARRVAERIAYPTKRKNKRRRVAQR